MLTPCRSRSASRYESVATEAQAVPGSREQHPGEDRPGVVARRAGNDLPQRFRERRGIDPDTVSRGLGKPGNSDAESVRNVVANRPASICTSSFVSSMFTVGPSSLCTISENNRGRQDGAAIGLAVDRYPNANRELEVGTDELELVAGDGEPQTGQHWHRAGS